MVAAFRNVSSMIARFAKSFAAVDAAVETARPKPPMFESLEGREFLSATSSSSDETLAASLAQSAAAAAKLPAVNVAGSSAVKKAAAKKPGVKYSGPITI